MIEVPVERMPHAADLPLPSYATAGSSGLDLLAAVDAEMVIDPGGIALVPTGVRLAIPAGYEGQVRPRSGLAHRYGLTVLNAPGTIDADYRGEIKVLLINHGSAPVAIGRGQRIAQLIVARVERIHWSEGTGLGETRRGSGGFGHTGT